MKGTSITAAVLTAAILVSGAGVAQGVTVEDITTALSDNFGDISDLTAGITVDSDNNNHDVTAGTYKYKQASSSKFVVDITSPSSLDIICDGTDVYDDGWTGTKAEWVATDSYGWISRFFQDTDVLWILDNNTFTLVPGTETVNEVTCRKITSTAFDIWVDDSEYAKVIRIDAKESGSPVRRYTFGGYSYVESTAYVWTECTATDSPGDDTETYDIELSNVDINESLSDSEFDLP